jgi:hypothetical protein
MVNVFNRLAFLNDSEYTRQTISGIINSGGKMTTELEQTIEGLHQKLDQTKEYL